MTIRDYTETVMHLIYLQEYEVIAKITCISLKCCKDKIMTVQARCELQSGSMHFTMHDKMLRCL